MQLIQNGQDYSLANLGRIPDKLPIGTYTLLFDERNKIYYLHQIDDIQLPKKIYGDINEFVRRVCIKYNSVERNLGVLAIGSKGSGKSLSARAISASIGLPVIVISESFDDGDFISFLTDPALGNCIILIDEFDKLYDINSRDVDSNKLLSLLDGPYNTHHIFIFTANEFYRINEMMKNRPSRIHFLKEFKGLNEDDVRKVGKDLLDNPDYIPDLVNISQKMTECTFDVVMSICKDCNLFKESPKIVVKYMNVLMESSNFDVFEVSEQGLEIFSWKTELNEEGRFVSGNWIESRTKKTEDGSPDTFWVDLNAYVPTYVDRDCRRFSIPEHKVELIARKRSKSFINYVY